MRSLPFFFFFLVAFQPESGILSKFSGKVIGQIDVIERSVFVLVASAQSSQSLHSSRLRFASVTCIPVGKTLIYLSYALDVLMRQLFFHDCSSASFLSSLILSSRDFTSPEWMPFG